MKRLLLIDDDPADLRRAADAASRSGAVEVVTMSSVHSARTYLEKALSGVHALPDGIVLDLDLGYESGFELLRFWHSTPVLNGVPLIVWSIVDEQREICELFKIKQFISKWKGDDAIREALEHLLA